ncbi:MAG: peptide/nickel transport system permease protein [Thermomicrobiales bacterium]|jgi:ABC-type dipeptide/oligopeptide/nickel transport system permease subunit|nr:peptide/nickel transport system permease protein [Thermomicrobiales bacterium]
MITESQESRSTLSSTAVTGAPDETSFADVRRDWLAIARRNWLATAALIFLVCLGLVAVIPSLFGIPDPLVTTPREAFKPPSRQHLFGTDDLGRDLFSRTVYGARVSLGTAVAVVAFAAAIGIPLGLIAGYREGLVDALMGRLLDLVLAFPAILLAMGLIAVLGQGWFNGAVAVTIVSIPAFARLTRASVLTEKKREYVLASRTIGANHTRLMVRTILPNCLGPLIVQAAFVATWAILLEAALSFLGLGVKPPTPSWGQMLSAGKTYLYRAWWYGFFPGLAMTLVVLSLNTLGETAQRILVRGWRGL